MTRTQRLERMRTGLAIARKKTPINKALDDFEWLLNEVDIADAEIRRLKDKYEVVDD